MWPFSDHSEGLRQEGWSAELEPWEWFGAVDPRQGAENSLENAISGANGLEPHRGSQVQSCFNWLWFNELGDDIAATGKEVQRDQCHFTAGAIPDPTVTPP
jgi:hypothetical protein